MRDQDVRRPPVIAWQEEPTLLGGTEAGGNSGVEQSIPESIVATYPLTSRAAAKCVVPKNVTVPEASWAGARRVEHRKPQAILDYKYELCGSQVKAKSLEGCGI